MSKKDIEQLRQAAENGETEAMVNLSMAYVQGEGVEKNLEMFFQWTRKAAEAGDVLAMLNLSIAYMRGIGVEKDLEQEISWTRKAAEAGHAVAMFNLSVGYMRGEGVEKDLEQAITWTRKAADADHVGAMANLGFAYLHGQGVEKDLERCIYWTRKAAEAGHAIAMFNLSIAYLHGQGVEKDFEQYIYWTREAAEAGDESAMFNFGLAYMEGNGVDVDVKEAAMWIKKAADENHARSIAPAMLVEFLENKGIDYDETISSFLSSIIEISIRINNIYNGLHMPEEAKIVYHYTDMSALQSMLNDNDGDNNENSNFLRLYSPIHFNDPEEGDIFLKPESFIRYFYSEEINAKRSGKNKEIYPHTISSGGGDFSFYICSFSGAKDRLDLWRAYGRDGKGYSVSLKISPELSLEKGDGHMITDAIKSESSDRDDGAASESSQLSRKIEKVFIRKVLYGEESVKKALGYDKKTRSYKRGSLGDSLKNLMEKLKKLNNKGFHADMKLLVKEIVRHMLGDLRYLYKSKEYSSEHEYRIVNLIDSSKFEIGIDRSKNPPRLYVETLPILFEDKGGKITAGPNVFDKDAVVVYLNHLIALNGWKNTTTAEKSRIPYK